MSRFLSMLLLVILGCKQPIEQQKLSPPQASKISHIHHEQGVEREDPYFWLNDRSDSSVIRHLEAENEYTEKYLAHTKDLQENIYDELVSRIEQKFESLPTKRNGYWYYVRFEEGNEYPFYCRKLGDLSAEEEIILNVNEMAEGYDVYRLFSYFVSPDNEKVAFLVDTSGNRQNTLYFKDLNTGQIIPENMGNCSYSGAWSQDSKYFFYTLNDHTVRSSQVFRHELGTNTELDQKIYEESDSTFSVSIVASNDKNFIFLGSGSSTTTEVRYLRSDAPLGTPTLVHERTDDLIYMVNSYTGNEFHIHHNHEAENFKISTASYDNPNLENWVDAIPHQEDILINNYMLLSDYMIVQERTNAIDKIRVINRNTGDSHYVDFGEEAYTANMYSPTDEFDSDSIRYNYSSLTTPQSIFSYQISNKNRALLKQQKVGENFDANLYESKRLWATAEDGVKVPISLVYRKDMLKKDGSNPCYVYAYGSYGSSSMPNFRSGIFSLLDRGFVYAIAHVRGGQEMGRYWYEDGKLLNKKNTFNDFIVCSEFLINENYTSSEGLFAGGGSAGGMLMGAIINMRPELFKGITAFVPWMDVITDMFNTDLPLTTLEYDEWGDPNDKEYFDYMLSWSPYDNVQKADYPAILATGGLNDSQVPYFSPAKWVQKVRENHTGDSPILFKCNMGAGHAGASGRFSRQEETALVYAFMLDQVGIDK